MEILACAVDPALLRAWEEHLAPAVQPFFLDEAQAARLREAGVVCAGRSSAKDLPLSLVDTFRVYRVLAEASSVAWLDEQAFLALDPAAKAELVAAQSHWWRGAVFELSTWGAVLGVEIADTAVGGRILLWPRTFHALPAAVRHEALRLLVSDDQLPCQRAALSEDHWRRIERRWPGVPAMAGTFLPRSGGNCLATVVAAFDTGAEPSAWMQREAFEQWLRDGLPQPCGPADPGAVLLWRDGGGGLQHAALSLGEGWVFHKEAQSWWAPRQVMRLEEVLERWRDVGEVEAWRRVARDP